jgi:CheY-like chemotaxis protein
MKTILIVDDLASVRFYHQLLLNQAGFRTLIATDGREAIALLEQNHVDLVMLDLLMPKMSGAEFLTRARAIGRYGRLPVLVITSEAQKETAQALRSGICEILQKPILPDSLLAAVRGLLG